MIYAYIRVSKPEQNIERQIDSILKQYPNINRENIYYDKKSGKDFNRKMYSILKEQLCESDELIVHELDRLGRNKDEIKKELIWFKEHGIMPRILNIPTTLISFDEQEWLMQMVNNILIEVYTTLAENERATLITRTVEGIEAARKRGRIGGRPPVDGNKIRRAFELYECGNYNISEICTLVGITRSTFYKYAVDAGINMESKPQVQRSRKHEDTDKGIDAFKSQKGVRTPPEIIRRAVKMRQSGFTVKDICDTVGISRMTFYKYLSDYEIK